MRARWVVQNTILTPAAGNGIWTRHWSLLAAARSRRRILRFRHGSGFYSIPVGGLVVRRARRAVDPTTEERSSSEQD